MTKTLAERQEEANFQEAVEYDLSDILTRLKKLEKIVKDIEVDLYEHIDDNYKHYGYKEK